LKIKRIKENIGLGKDLLCHKKSENLLIHTKKKK